MLCCFRWLTVSSPAPLKQDISVVADIRMEVPDIVFGDGGRLRQVLTNLVGNAIKFTENGHVVMHASVTAQDDEFVRVLFEVEDSGIGISEHDLQNKLFKPFMQVDDGSRRRYEVYMSIHSMVVINSFYC